MAPYDSPFVCANRAVEEQWIDYNGHFNMAYYSVVFDTSADEAFFTLGLGPDYIKQSNCSFYTLEVHINYLREMHRGDKIGLTFQVLDYDAKRMHYFQTLHHADEGWIAATLEGLCIHVDMSGPKSTPWPQDLRREIAAMHSAHAGLPTPAQVGHTIGIRRKVA